MKHILFLFLLLPLTCNGSITVRDDAGNSVVLERPAQRIVSLAPNVTELLFAAGAGNRVVGAVDFSDFPAAALKLERVGGAAALDIERIVALRPDLVVAWQSGNSIGQIDKLKNLGITIYYTEPRHLADIPADIEKLGLLAGTESVASAAAMDFRLHYEKLKNRYAGKSPVTVFYEIWNRPLMSVNNAHIISDVLHLCGARNVFGNLPVLIPSVSLEAVIDANPQAIIASGIGNVRPPWLDEWRKWGGLTAVLRNNLYFIPADYINRQAPRILLGAAMLCSRIDEVRTKLGQNR